MCPLYSLTQFISHHMLTFFSISCSSHSPLMRQSLHGRLCRSRMSGSHVASVWTVQENIFAAKMSVFNNPLFEHNLNFWPFTLLWLFSILLIHITIMKGENRITIFKMVNILIAFRIWGKQWTDSKVVIYSDSGVVVHAFQHCRVREEWSGAVLREEKNYYTNRGYPIKLLKNHYKRGSSIYSGWPTGD